MTKSEFVDQVADRAGLSKKDAASAVDAVLETIEGALKRGSEVVFSGFGKFSVSHRSAREGRNPATGETIHIAASRVPKFTAGAGAEEGGEVVLTQRSDRGVIAAIASAPRRDWRASATGSRAASPSAPRRWCSGSIPIRRGCGRARSSSPAAAGSRPVAPAARAAFAVAVHCALAIEAVAEHCVAVKLQVACFERLGAPGWARARARSSSARASAA